MKNVNNRAVVKRIADETRKANRGKNIIAVLAIMLTAVLFTSVFTIGGSILDKVKQEKMRSVGTDSHAGIKCMTMDEYEQLKTVPWVKNTAYRIYMGGLANDELRAIPTEVSYMEDAEAKMSFSYPTAGSMPEKENEIMTSTIVLDALNVPYEVGATVHAMVAINDEVIEQDFVLSGYYEGDLIAPAQMVCVSKKFQEKYIPVKTDSVLDKRIEYTDFNGRIAADINYYAGIGIVQQTGALCNKLGWPADMWNVGVNWAYMGMDLDAETVGFFIAVLLLIIISGYLIIYNIFYINVYRDIRYYGLLKTIGTTGKQLKKIVWRQAYMLSFMGIPIGLFVGAFVGKVLLPFIMGELNFTGAIDYEIELKLWIFVFAAAFSLLTVYISCIKPCRIAAEVTAVAAVQYTEGQVENLTEDKIHTKRHGKKRHDKVHETDGAYKNDKVNDDKESTAKNKKESSEGKGKSVENKGKSFENIAKSSEKKVRKSGKKARSSDKNYKQTRKVTIFELARQNTHRSGKKLMVVVASLSLSLILLNGIYGLVIGFDLDKYVEGFSIADFQVNDGVLYNGGPGNADVALHGVTWEFLDELNGNDLVKETGNVYATECVHDFTDEEYAGFEKRIFDNPDAQGHLMYYAEMGYGMTNEQAAAEENIRHIREEHFIDGTIYGVSDTMLDKLENVEGQLDVSKLNSGNYVIATRCEAESDDGVDVNYFNPGDKVTLHNENGDAKEYEVLAVADISGLMRKPWSQMFNCEFILSENEYLNFMGDMQPMTTFIDVDEENIEDMEAWLTNYTENVDTNLTYNSKKKVEEEFYSTKQMVRIVGGCLVMILAAIGILNFINTMITSMLSRRQEFAMMEAVGMTGKQLKQMLCLEGVYYALYTTVCSVVLGVILSATAFKEFGEMLFAYTWRFSVTPILLCIPVLVVIASLVPWIGFKTMVKESVVERLRVE